ncbi:MAG: hypothetical protein OJF52_001523 [Nitrospira sp.]|nr:MAG: hypothetical protein OJF52_001523 [Nitrospira sp.]
MSKARQTLERVGFRASRIRLKFGYEEEVAGTILEEARKGRYQTGVILRRARWIIAMTSLRMNSWH